MFNRVYSAPTFLVMAILSLACLSACGRKNEDANDRGARGAASVGVMVVQPRPLNLTQELTGRTSAWLVSDVRPQVGGIVKARQFTEGALVTAGQSLYQIDPATYQADYDSALAAEQQAQAAADAAALRFERSQQLITIKAISQQELDRIEQLLARTPIFAGYDRARLEAVANQCVDVINRSGVEPALDAAVGALPDRLQDTAYALAVEIAVVDLHLPQEELRLLEMIRDLMKIDRLVTAAIEAAARARMRTA